MNFVKWIRKNNRKIMVFVVIFCMVSFVIGSFGIKLLVGLLGGGSQLIAMYDDGKKFNSQHFMVAQSELAVLRMLMADRLLMAQSRSGLSGPLLVYLLFPDSPFAGEIASQMKQAVQRGQLQISMEQLNDYFQQRRERPEILWLLLKSEALRAGCVLPNESAAQTLRFAIPQMTNNQIDGAAMINQIISKNNITEEQILRIFGDLLSVLSYAGNVMDNEAVTINQIKASIGRNREGIDVEYVEIAAEPFIDRDIEITDAQIQAQFEKYKGSIPNIPTDENPFGFGYRLPKRVQLEYIIVQMDDVQKQIEKPTPEELENHYSSNLQNYQISEPSDPNDPESEKTSRIRTFAEAEAMVRRELEQEKITTLANILFNELKDQTETGFQTLNVDQASVDQLQKAAGDFEAVGNTLAEKYRIPIVTGKTGWLSADLFAADNILNSLSMQHGQSYLRLSDVAFAVTEERALRQQIGMPSIRVWENIGPLNGGFYSQEQNKYHKLMALVRVVGIRESQVPDTVDIEYNTKSAVLSETEPPEESRFSLKEAVRNDILLINAMDTAKSRAQELAQLVQQKGWDNAITAYNDTYAPNEPNEPVDSADSQTGNRIELETISGQSRISQSEIEIAKRVMLENPAAAKYIQRQLVSNVLTNKLYDLLPEDDESTGTIQTILPFEARQVCLLVKEVRRQPATIKDYADSKAQTSLQLSAAQSAALAFEHFNGENILKRMNFQSEVDQMGQSEQEPPLQDDVKE